MENTEELFHGDIVTPDREKGLRVLEQHYVTVCDGTIREITPVLPESYKGREVT